MTIALQFLRVSLRGLATGTGGVGVFFIAEAAAAPGALLPGLTFFAFACAAHAGAAAIARRI